MGLHFSKEVDWRKVGKGLFIRQWTVIENIELVYRQNKQYEVISGRVLYLHSNQS